MSFPRRLVAPVLVPVLLLAGCTVVRDVPDGETTPSPTPSPITTIGPINTTPGTYEYRNAGITAVLKLEGNTGTLKVRNESGRDLGRPDVYVLDARDGSEIPGKVVAAQRIRDGETQTFEVSFPPNVGAESIGLAVLVIGGDNFGAFFPR